MQRTREWLPPLPPPPREFVQLLTRARKCGYWLRCAHNERVRQEFGGRYWVSWPTSQAPLYANDDLENIRGWLACN